MNNKIIVFGPGSGSNVFQNFSQSIKAQFASIGVTALIPDLQAQDFQQRLLSLIQEAPLAALSFAGIGGMFNIDGKNLWELFRIPFVSLFGDSPAYYFDLHFMGSNWQFGLYGFPEHTDLRQHLNDEIVYDFDSDSLRDKIEWILANKEEVVHQGVNRTELYKQKFHISHFYSQLANIAEFIRFANADTRPEAFPDYLEWPPALS